MPYYYTPHLPPGNPWDRDCSGDWYLVWQSHGGKGSSGLQEKKVRPKKRSPERRAMLAFIKQHRTEWEDFQKAGQTRIRGEPAFVHVAWTCHACLTQHHNLKKPACRVCFTPRDVDAHA